MELKPCPFCGHTPIENKCNDILKDMWIIKCCCGINTGYYHDKNIMQKAWNTRK